jgi:cytochrome P450
VAGSRRGTLKWGTMNDLSKTYWQHPESTALMREQSAVHWVRLPPPWGSVLVALIVRRSEAIAALEDDQCLGKDRDTLIAIMESQMADDGQPFVVPAALAIKTMLVTDGPDHSRLRRIVAPAFDARVGGGRGRVREIVTEILNRLGAAQPIDMSADIAVPLSMKVIGELVGVPEKDHAKVAEWSAIMVRDDPVASPRAAQALRQYLAGLIDVKRHNPADDLINDLLSHRDRGLTTDELLATLILLLVPGHEATAAAISNATAALLGPSRDLWRAMAEDPSIVPDVVKEMLRLHGSSRHASFRYTRKTLTFGPDTIPPGTIVLVSIHSANRDRHVTEAAAPCLRRVEAERDDLAFGRGVHQCFGAQLATIIIQTLFGQLPQRFPNARLNIPLETLQRTIDPIFMGYEFVPVVLRP